MQPSQLFPILDYINFDSHPEIAELAITLRTKVHEKSQIDEVIKEIQAPLKDKHRDRHNEKSPYYHLLLSCAFSFTNLPIAINYAERAVSQFRNQEKARNQFLCCWILGLFLVSDKQVDRAREVIFEAISGFQSLHKANSINGKYDECDCCQEIINKLKEFQAEIDDNRDAPQTYEDKDSSDSKSNRPFSDEVTGYIFFPQLPVFTQVQAGIDGPIWVKPSSKNTSTVTNQFLIQDRKYTIFSVSRGDRRIMLDPYRNYGWAEVKGNSMNRAQPTSIDSGNMVLFYQSIDAPENAFVIVSCPHGSGSGESYIVKRWNKANQEFISDSSETNHIPIPFGRDFRIIGIVVAVAKLS